ncbi:MAG: hypothetical protein H0T56_05080 [Pseudaminobacter sp.]|nr:hypothetical protein [Pseudaminobacter sp.]
MISGQAGTEKFLENSMIVGAHPDDELLWFSSIVGKVGRVVIVFRDYWADPALGQARAAAISQLPLGNVQCLDIAEAGSYGCANWAIPVLTDYGIQLGLEETKREVKRLTRMSVGKVLSVGALNAPERVAAHYRRNFQCILDRLEPMLSPGMNVFTHNPWGEYGHEDHIQLFRVLDRLRSKIGFRLWMSNYCTDRSLPLAMRYFSKAPGGYIRLPTDKALAEKIASVYRRHGCWTWADDWAWCDEECFMEAPSEESGGMQHHLFPLNLFTIDEPERSLRLPLTASAMAISAMVGATLMESI